MLGGRKASPLLGLLGAACALAVAVTLAGGGAVSCARFAGGPETPAPPAATPTPAGPPWKLTILHFNDFHGHFGPPAGNGPRLATLIAEARKEAQAKGSPVVLLFAGDSSRDCGLSGRTRGGSDVAFLGDAGVVASAIGNHDFDHGLDGFLWLRQMARFPYLAANVIRSATGTPLVDPAALVDLRGRGGPTIALIGLTTTDAPATTRPENVAGLAFTDPVEATRGQLARPELAGADVQIVLSHQGFEADCQVSCQVADVDLVVGAHNHFAFEKARLGGHAPIVQAGDNARFLGRVEMAGVADRVTSFSAGLVPVASDTAEDPAGKARANDLAKQLLPGPEAPIGVLGAKLDGEQEQARRRETNFGDLLADLVRERMGAEVAIVNGGTIRGSIDAGPVFGSAATCALPFPDRLVVLPLTGAQLRWLLERSAALDPLQNPGGFLQISGARIRIEGARLASVTIGDAPLDDARVYRVATTGFLASGGDQYEVLKSVQPAREEAVAPAELLIERIKAGTLDPRVDGRIEITDRPGSAGEIPESCVCATEKR